MLYDFYVLFESANDGKYQKYFKVLDHTSTQ